MGIQRRSHLEYERLAEPVIDLQLEKAGVRLARLLDDALRSRG